MIDDDLDDLLGAYALDAVNDDERKLIEAYLLRSPTARAEVQRHHEVAAVIAASPGEAPAPLWLRIEALIDDRTPSEASLAMPELRPAQSPTQSPAQDPTSSWSPVVGRRPQTAEPVSADGPSRTVNTPGIRTSKFGRRQSGAASQSGQSSGGTSALPARSRGFGRLGRIGMAFAGLTIVSLGISVVRLNNTNRVLQRDANATKREGAQLLEAAKAEAKRADALAAKLVAASNRDVRLEKLLLSPSTKTVTLTSAAVGR
jgi:hypothetical protein